MKKIIFYSICLMSTLFFSSFTSPNHHGNDRYIEGFWAHNNSNQVYEVRAYRGGFKARNTRGGDWFRYRKIKSRTYENFEGDRLIIDRRENLVWRSWDGRRTKKMRKVRRQRTTRSRNYCR